MQFQNSGQPIPLPAIIPLLLDTLYDCVDFNRLRTTLAAFPSLMNDVILSSTNIVKEKV